MYIHLYLYLYLYIYISICLYIYIYMNTYMIKKWYRSRYNHNKTGIQKRHETWYTWYRDDTEMMSKTDTKMVRMWYKWCKLCANNDLMMRRIDPLRKRQDAFEVDSVYSTCRVYLLNTFWIRLKILMCYKNVWIRRSMTIL